MPRGYCSSCLTMTPNCKESYYGLVHIHCKPTIWFGRIETPMTAYRNEQTYRLELGLSYYDLISLPTGGHVPVPKAVHLIGKDKVASIPMDRQRWRDERFFHCDQCFGDGLSFFRCKVHPEISDVEYNHAKDVYLITLSETGKLGKCRYLRAKEAPGFDRRDRF